jgi:hypothetical protein
MGPAAARRKAALAALAALAWWQSARLQVPSRLVHPRQLRQQERAALLPRLQQGQPLSAAARLATTWART